ncbi:MAG: DUF5677 domain-containing protein [Gammaproteobacteria bacterium]
MLYYTLIESVKSVVVLVENDCQAGVTAIIRSALDAFVDITNLSKHETYNRHLIAADAANWKKWMEAASVPGNEFLLGLRTDPDFALNRKEIRKRFEEAAEQQAKKLDVEERFECAGLKREYKSLYGLLSAEAHNNISALTNRHMVSEGEQITVNLHTGKGCYGLASLLTLAEMLLFASEIMHVKWGFGEGLARDIRDIVEPIRIAAVQADSKAIVDD